MQDIGIQIAKMNWRQKIKQIMEDYPKNHQFNVQLAEVLQKNIQSHDLIRYSLQTLEKDPKNHLECQFAGIVFQSIGHYNDANNWYLQAQVFHPQPKTLYIRLQKIHKQMRNYQKAKHYLLKIMNYQDPQMLVELGYYQMEMMNTKKARGHFLKALKLQPYTAEAMVYLGVIEISKENYKKAKAYCFKVLQISPQLSSPYWQLGIIYYQSGQTYKAQRYFRKAIEKQPAQSSYYHDLALCLQETARKDEAIHCLLTALKKKQNRQYLFVISLLELIQQQKNKQKHSKGHSLLYKKILSINPYIPKVYYKLALDSNNKLQTDKIISLYIKGLQMGLKFMLGFYNSVLGTNILSKKKSTLFNKHIILAETYLTLATVVQEIKITSLALQFFKRSAKECQRAEKQIKNKDQYVIWMTNKINGL